MKRIWDRLGIVFYNFFVTHIPFYAIRHGVLRLWGAKIGKGSAIFRNTTVLGIDKIRIGENVVLSHSGWGDGFYPVVTTHAGDGTLLGVHVDLLVAGPEEDDEDED